MLGISGPTRLILLMLIVLLSACGGQQASKEASNHLNRSATYAAQGQYRAAIIEARNAVNLEPANIDYRRRLAELYITLGAGDQAEKLLSDLSLEQSPRAQLALARAYNLQGKHLSATEWLSGLTFSDPTLNQEKTLLLANAMQIRGDYHEALDHYRDILAASPDHHEARSALISNLIQLRQFNQASREAEAFLADRPDSNDAQFLRAYSAFLQDDLETAEQLLTKTATNLSNTDILLPEKARVLELLARTLTEQGKFSEAMVYNRTLANANPEAASAKQRFSEALQAAQSGQLEVAKTAFEDILEQHPNDHNSAMLLGLINLQQGDLDSGAALLIENVDAETSPVAMIRAAALAQIELGKSQEAISVLKRALLARPDDISLMSLYGVFALTQESTARDGVITLNKALQIDPERSRLRLALAQYYLDRDNTEQALAQLRTAFDTTPTDWPTTSYYLATLLRLDETAEAEQVKQQLDKRFADMPDAQLAAGITEFRLDQQQSALNRLSRLVQNNPDYTRGRAALARMHQSLGNREQAARHYLALARQTPDQLGALLSAAQLANPEASVDSMIAWLNTVGKQTPELQPNATALIADLERRRGNTDAALKLTEAAEGHRALSQVRAAAYADRAFHLAGEEQWPEAKQAVTEAIALAPDNRPLKLLMAQIEAASGNRTQAGQILAKLEEEAPGNPDTVAARTRIINRLDGRPEAYNYLKPIWQSAPDGRLADLILTLTRAEEPGSVIQVIDEWTAAEPGSIQAWLAKGDEHLRREEPMLAQQAYEQVLTLAPRNPVALNNLAWLLREKDTELALTYARTAFEVQPENPDILDTYAVVLQQSGNLGAAEILLEKALSLAPNNEEIRQHLADLRARAGS